MRARNREVYKIEYYKERLASHSINRDRPRGNTYKCRLVQAGRSRG